MVTTQASTMPEGTIASDCATVSQPAAATTTTVTQASTKNTSTTTVPNTTGSQTVTTPQANTIISSSSSITTATTASDIPESPPTTTHIGTEIPAAATTQDTRISMAPLSVSNNITAVITGSIMGGFIATLLLVAIVLLAIVVIQQRKQKQYKINSDHDDVAEHQLDNPTYDG